ncbi:methyltransferase domain-containing protein [Streptomyces sp. NPDC001594]|uniref:methyltransferase domain-containing protein n=1 Tax=Streptomyces sp. NPDC001594 TaxID=3364590 RepID=UPI0036A2836E
MLASGAEAVAVEPDPAMLAELRRGLRGVRALAGSAEAIPLPDGSVDAVLAGNAMHWFDMSVAGPGGWDRAGERQRRDRPARHPGELARRDRGDAPSAQRRPPVRLAGAVRVPARAAPHRRLPRGDARDARGDARHAGGGTGDRPRPDPRLPRRPPRDRGRRVHAADADRRPARRRF